MTYSARTAEILANTNTAGSQGEPQVVVLADGRLVVVWGGPTAADNADWAVRAQFFSADGVKIGGEILLTDVGGGQSVEAVTALPNGEFAVAWITQDSDLTLTAQFFDGAGIETSAEVPLEAGPIGDISPTADLLALPNGSIVAVWTYEGNGGDVRGATISPSGARVDFPSEVNTQLDGIQYDPSSTLLSNGNFVVTWTEVSNPLGDSTQRNVKAQIFSPAGLKIGGEITVNTTLANSQDDSDVLALPSGGFVAVWVSVGGAGDNSGSSIRGQLFDSSGAKIGSEFLVNTVIGNDQTSPSLSLAEDGGFLVSWTDFSGSGTGDPNVGINAQQFAADGTRIGAQFLANSTIVDFQVYPSVAAFSNGDVAIVWQDYSGTGGNSSGTGLKLRLFTVATLGTESADLFTGTGGDEDFRGLGGNDTFYLQQGGDDEAEGGDGDDTFYFGNAYTSADRVDGGAGNDRLVLQGQYGNLQLNALSLVNVETILLLTASNNAFGGAGASPTFYSIKSVDANLAAGSSLLVDGRQLAANEYLNFDGSAESDGSFFLYGGAAVDTLTGGAGRDTLDGGAGNDTLAGGANDDIYFVDHPGDIVDEAVGGGSFDAVYTRVNYVLKAGSEVELLAATGLALGQAIALTGNELGQSLVSGSGHDDLNGGGGADFLIANAGNDSLNGGTGLDNMSGGAGDDIYFVDMLGDIVIELAGEGTDSVYASATYQLSGGAEVELLATTGLAPGQAITLFGNDFAQSIIGATGNDILYGFGGNDSLVGNEGNDTLDGGGGNDVLRGGLGLDIFQFSSVADSTGAGDAVLDFLNGVDKIDLSLIDANVNVPGNHAFTFIGTNAFGGVAGQLRVESSGGLVNVLGDVDGDGNADLIIHLYNTGGVMPNAGDFVL